MSLPAAAAEALSAYRQISQEDDLLRAERDLLLEELKAMCLKGWEGAPPAEHTLKYAQYEDVEGEIRLIALKKEAAFAAFRATLEA